MDFDYHQLSQQMLSALSQISALAQQVERLEQQLQQMQQRLQPEPTTVSPRLHIAALIISGWAANPDIDQKSDFMSALAIADKLMEAAENSRP